jgi:hypothetical protein
MRRSVADVRPLAVIAPLAAAIALAALAPSAAAFQVWRHSNMTGEVLGRLGVSGSSLSVIQQGARWADVAQCRTGCYCPEIPFFWCDPSPGVVELFSQYHYDNNRIAEGMELVNAMMYSAHTRLNRAGPPVTEAERREVRDGLMDFGRALHAIQDFYAHSTWVELNHDLVRIGGRIESAPMWNGETNWGTGTCDVGGVTVAGVQTGFERLPTPPGSVSHAMLNKDHGNTAQGQKVVNRIFPFGLIGTYYEIASGQNAASGGSYKDTGLAPRHTIRAYQCIEPGCAVYQLPGAPHSAVSSAGSTMSLASLLDWVNNDPEFIAAAAFMDSVWAAADRDSPQTFPSELFDADGWPLPPSLGAEDLLRPEVRLLERAWPNPSGSSVAIRFRAPAAGRVRLAVFDLAGRRVKELLDGDPGPGWSDLRWDGTDDAGARLRSGSYIVRLEGFGRVESASLRILR